MKLLVTAAALLLVTGCGAQAAPDPHDGQVRALASDGTNVGRLDEAAVRIKLGAPDLRKRETIAGARYVEMNYTPPGCSFFFDATSGLLARAECQVGAQWPIAPKRNYAPPTEVDGAQDLLHQVQRLKTGLRP